MNRHIFTLLTGPLTAALITGLAAQSEAATLVPDPVGDIGLTVKVTELGSFAPYVYNNNYASPIAVGDYLYVVNQRGAQISTWQGGTLVTALSDLPTGVTPTGANAILNMAGSAGTTYVRFTSSTLPSDFGTIAGLPDEPAYGTTPLYELVYAYDQAADGTLGNPRAVTAFETTNIIGVHRGDGMLVLPDGRLLIARGDNLNGNDYGLTAPQDDSETVGKLLLIDPADGSVTVVAEGVRNVQQITWADSTQTQIAFSDIGWRAAEEINVIDLADLLDTSTVENFGWGIAADGLAREGMFYVGYDGSGTAEVNATVLGEAPLGEAGFVQPYAQFGREDLSYSNLFAVTGPVTSADFMQIGLLFGDIADGNLFATLKDASADVLNDVFKVWALEDDGSRVSLADWFSVRLSDARINLRLFTFTDGSVGLISERSGMIYALSEVLPAVPLPAGGLLLLSALFGVGVIRRRR